MLELFPGSDHKTVPIGMVGPPYTVISADAPPAVIVTFPAAAAVSTGGVSDERLTMDGSLDVQVRPGTVAPSESRACNDRVSPTSMLTTCGVNVMDGVPLIGTRSAVALLHLPFCSTLRTPVTALAGTTAVTIVSLHLLTAP